MLEPVYHVPSPVRFEEVVTSSSSISSPPTHTTFLGNDSSNDCVDVADYNQHLHEPQQQEIQNYQQTLPEDCGWFCVKWLNFGEHLRQSLKDLQERGVHDSTDIITFACQRNINARRWVLHKAKRNVVMTTSLLLRNELQARPDDRTICLWDVNSKTMTQVLHYIKHGTVFGPIREMNALIKANHILRVGAIWPDKYAYRLAALIGSSQKTNNKLRMSDHKPWVKTEIEEIPVEQYEEIHDEIPSCTNERLISDVPNVAMDSKTANQLPPSPLPPRRKSVIVDATEVWLPPKYQTKWFSAERLPNTAKEGVTPQTRSGLQRILTITSRPDIISPPALEKEPVSTSTAVQPPKTRNIYDNIFQKNSSTNFYCKVYAAFDRQSSLHTTNREPNQNQTPPAPHNSPVDDNLPCSYEVITPPPQTTTCASVPAGVKMMPIYSTNPIQCPINLAALSPQTYPTIATTESSAETTLMPRPKTVKSENGETTKMEMLQGPNQNQSSETPSVTNQASSIKPLPPFNQIKLSTPRMIQESQHLNQNPTPILSHLIQNSSSTETVGDHATSLSGSQTPQAVTLQSPQVLPIVTPVLPQTLKPITPPPPPYNTQGIKSPSPQPNPQATSVAPMPRKKYIMALAYTQETDHDNTNSSICAQEIHTNQPTLLRKHTPSTMPPSSLQSSYIPTSLVQRPMPTQSPFPHGRFSLTEPQLRLSSPFIQKHKTSYPYLPNQIMGPPPPKRPTKIPSTVTRAEFHYNTNQTLQALPQDPSGHIQHHVGSASRSQQFISQDTEALKMESFQKSQAVQRVQTAHNYPTIVTKLNQQVKANQYHQRRQSQIDLHRNYFKMPQSTAQFQQQQRLQEQQRQQYLQQRQQFMQQRQQQQSLQLTPSSTQRSILQTRAHPYHRQTTYTASSVYGYHQTSTPPFPCKWCCCEKTFHTKLQLRFHFLFEHKSVESLRNSPTDSLKAGRRATDNYTYNYKCLNQCGMIIPRRSN